MNLKQTLHSNGITALMSLCESKKIDEENTLKEINKLREIYNLPPLESLPKSWMRFFK